MTIYFTTMKLPLSSVGNNGADPTHLAERRRFFTVWLARLLGMDFSNDLAH